MSIQVGVKTNFSVHLSPFGWAEQNWKFSPFLYSKKYMNDTFKVISDFILQFQLALILGAAI